MVTILELQDILTTAAALYPNFKMQVTPAQFTAAWYRHVGHLDADKLQAAMDRAVHGSTFFPTVHDVLTAAGQIAAGEPRTGLEAWHDLTVAVREHGRSDPPGKPGGWQFDDPVTTEAAILLGWAQFCMSDEDNLRWAFAKIYDACAARRISQSVEMPSLLAAGNAPKELQKP